MPLLQRTFSVDEAFGRDPRFDIVLVPWTFTEEEGRPARIEGAPLTLPLAAVGDSYTADVPDAVYSSGSDSPGGRYIEATARTASLEALTSRIAVTGRVAGDQVAAVITVAALVLPARPDTEVEEERDELRAPGRAGGLFFAAADTVAAALAELGAQERPLHLRALCVCTVLEGQRPRFEAPPAAVARRLGARATEAIEWVRQRWDVLTDVRVAMVASSPLRLAGTLALTPADPPATAMDFRTLSVVADWVDTGGVPADAVRAFDEATVVADGKASFDLLEGRPLFAAGLGGSIRVRIRGLAGTTLLSETYAVDDERLMRLDLVVPRQRPAELERPVQPVADPNLRLRGRVLSLGSDCGCEPVTVLVRARTAADGPWRIVGAAIADTSGNFTMPYPFGTYVAAQSTTSLAPDEAAEIPIVAETGATTISTDFLWLAARDTRSTERKDRDGCSCGDADVPSRLPDFAQVIGNANFSQDLGSGCVNLSKPNRTINEFRYQAIVRTSDPDMAMYSLERHEVALGEADAAMAERLEAAVEAFRLQTVTVRDGFPAGGDPATTRMRGSLQRCVEHAVEAGHEVARAAAIVLDGLAAARSHLDAIVGLIDAAQARRRVDGLAPAPSVNGLRSDARALIVALTAAVDAVGTSSRYELVASAAVHERPSVSLATPIDWQRTPRAAKPASHVQGVMLSPVQTLLPAALLQLGLGGQPRPGTAATAPRPAIAHLAQAVSVATGHLLHYAVVVKADGYSLGDLTYSLPLAPGQKKEIVVFDAAQALVGAEQQALTQSERLTAELTDERDVATRVAGGIGESLNGRSASRTSGVSAGGGVAAGGSIGAFSLGGVIGVSGGTSSASSSAGQTASRDVAEFFGERLREAIMQNAESYRRSTASVVTTVRQGQQYGVTSEVVWLSGVTGLQVPDVDFFGEGLDDRAQWELYARMLGYHDDGAGKAVYKMLDYYFANRLIAEWDTIFDSDIAPLIFERLIDGLRLDGFTIDVTAAERYTGGDRVATLTLTGRTGLTRVQLPEVIRLTEADADVRDLAKHVTVVVDDLRLSYSTEHYDGLLYAGTMRNDLLDGIDLYIPVQAEEKRNPRREDRYLAAALVEHLNTHLEHYNKVLWADLDPDRRFMLLDGFDIQTYRADGTVAADGSGLRSLASVVKNEVIGIAGNALVMPVAPGYRVSQSLITTEVDGRPAPDLFDHYRPLTPVEPYRVSVPTRGVYAEAVMGRCDSCEKIESDRAQDWSVFTTDEPTPVSTVPLAVPEQQDWKAVWKDFAAPLVNVQTAPAAPAPGAGLAGLADLLGKSDAFRDVTGLAGTENNALQTYLSNQANAKAFAQMATEMAKQSHNTTNSDKIMGSIDAARASGTLAPSDASALVKQHLQEQIDGGAAERAAGEQAAKQAVTPLSQAAVKAADAGREVHASRTDDAGNAETLSITGAEGGHVLAQVLGTVPKAKQASPMACWATVAAMMAGWKRGTSVDPEQAVVPAGERYAQMLADDTGLPAEDKDDFVLRMGMAAEPPASYPLSTYIDLMKRYGPLWLTTDAAAGARFSPHARVLTSISGRDADDLNAVMTFIDPATGLERTESFTAFVKAYEEVVTDSRSDVLMPQIVHFTDPVAGTEGYQVRLDGDVISVHEPVHELITMAALQRSTLSVPPATAIGADLAVNEFLRGVLWNDDPALLFFTESRTTNWDFSTGAMWFSRFHKAETAKVNDLRNIIGRSHFFDLQFLHAMASAIGEQPQDTVAKIMLWCEAMYRLSVGDGIAPTDTIASATVTTSWTDASGTAHPYSLGTFFSGATDPGGSATFAELLGRGTRFGGFDPRRRAIGSVLHLIQDSYARGHVRRTLANSADLAAPPSIDTFKAGSFGHWTDVENFHDYRSQNHAQHDRYDAVPTRPDPARLDTFNAVLGARDAIDASVAVLNHWNAHDPWTVAQPTIAKRFTLAAAATPADGSV